MGVESQIRALVERHCATVRQQVDAIAVSLSGLGLDGPGQDPRLGEAIGLAHQIKGTSGSVGFHEVSARAAELEQSLKALAAHTGAVSEAQIVPSKAQFEALRAVAETLTPTMSPLYTADLSHLEKSAK